MSNARVLVEVVSDNVCPWCFVGKRNLEAAMAQFKDALDFEVVYFPYSLHGNTMQPEGMGLSDYIYKVYGRRMDVNDKASPLKAAGEKVGIQFNNERTMVNTLDSHRLISFAKEQNMQLEMVEAIFHEYFENAVNISNLDNLQKIGEGVLGKEKASEIEQCLQGSQYKQEVEKHISNIKQTVSGVPYFTIYDHSGKKRDLLSGAQPTERFSHTFQSIVNALSAL